MRSDITRTISVAIPQLTRGGAEKVTIHLASRLLADGRLSRIYTGSPQDADALRHLPLVQLNAPRALQAVPRFLRALEADPADSFLLTLGYINLAPFVRMRRPSARIVLRIGNTASAELLTLPRLARFRYLGSMRLALRAADAVVAQSRYMADDLARLFRGVGDKLAVIHNFIEHELWSWQPPSDPPLAQPYLFCAASMKPQKGLDLLLAAYARSARRASARLVIAGVATDDPVFSRLMRDNGLSDEDVLRLGFVPTPYAWMAHSELCVLASRFEGFSNFLLEAAALGKRIVATDCPGGNAELFEHYPNAEVVPTGDIGALAAAIEAPRRDLDRDQARQYLGPFEQERIYRRYLDVLAGERSEAA